MTGWRPRAEWSGGRPAPDGGHTAASQDPRRLALPPCPPSWAKMWCKLWVAVGGAVSRWASGRRRARRRSPGVTGLLDGGRRGTGRRRTLSQACRPSAPLYPAARSRRRGQTWKPSVPQFPDLIGL